MPNRSIIDQSLEELVNGFGEDCRLRGLTGKTIREYQVNIRLFLELITDMNLDLQEVDQHIDRSTLMIDRYNISQRRIAQGLDRSY